MGKEIITKVRETQRAPNRINPRQNTLRHILIKLTKTKHKEQILKTTREKQQITHKGIPTTTADLSIETLRLLVGTFNPFTFKVIIDEYDPVAIYSIVLG